MLISNETPIKSIRQGRVAAMIEPGQIKVAINERESVTALLYPAAKRERAGATLVLGHGAGANQSSAFMRMVAGGLATRGIDALTFNFLYTERGRRIPDPKARLESCYRAVINVALKHRKLKKNRLVIGGKSMGGRIASQVAAADGEGVAGLVFLGYPLHPPGRPDKLRDEHLKEIRAPMLFVQGARDAFGTEGEIRAVIEKLRLPATLYAVEGGDHSFKVPKSAGVPQQKVFEDVMDEVARWVVHLPSP
jgi:predicted alpha/beta-hydrolase family hydrolase